MISHSIKAKLGRAAFSDAIKDQAQLVPRSLLDRFNRGRISVVEDKVCPTRPDELEILLGASRKDSHTGTGTPLENAP